MKTVITLVFMILTFSATANGGVDPTKKAFEKWNRQFVTYPSTSTAKKEQGLVYVSFELSELGEAENVSIESGSNTVLNEKALEMVQDMPKSHLYTNGFIEGTRFIVPIKFEIQ